MSKKLRLQRGEIATIITIVSLVVLGASTLVSSAFLSKNKQTTSTKAAEPVTCTGANNWNCAGQTQTCGGVACGKCAQRTYDGGWSRCVGPNCQRNQSTVIYNYPVFDSDDSCNPTAAQTPTQSDCEKITDKGTCDSNAYIQKCAWYLACNVCRARGTKNDEACPKLSCSNWSNNTDCTNTNTCQWNDNYFKCVDKIEPTKANTPVPTRKPGLELPGYENCNRCCIQDLQCGIPADGNGYKCGKDQTRIRWYSYNCTSNCSNFNSAAQNAGTTLTRYIDCPPDVGRENRLKCVDGGCANYYGGLPVPTSIVPTAQPTIPLGTINTCVGSGYSCITDTDRDNNLDCKNAGYSIESYEKSCGQNSNKVCCYGTLTPTLSPGVSISPSQPAATPSIAVTTPTSIPMSTIVQGGCIKTNCGGANNAFDYYQKCTSPYGDSNNRQCGNISYYSDGECQRSSFLTPEVWCNDQKRFVIFRLIIDSITGQKALNYKTDNPYASIYFSTPDIGGGSSLCRLEGNNKIHIPTKIVTGATFNCVSSVKKNFTNVTANFCFFSAGDEWFKCFGASSSYTSSGSVDFHLSL